MAFTMTHLIISKNISEIFDSHIKNLPQFYLGTIAPDTVHNRANYTSEYKKASHLITQIDLSEILSIKSSSFCSSSSVYW